MAEQQDYAFDSEKGGEYPEWLYNYATTATSGVNTFDDITDEHIQQFHERGYLVIYQAFTQIETSKGMAGLLDLIGDENPDFKNHQLEKTTSNKVDSQNINQQQEFVRKIFSFVEYDQGLKDMAFHPKLIHTLQRIIGDEDLNMFQDMALIKQARVGREKPWHQDMAYFKVPLDATIVGAWIALDEATVDNGCMMVIPGSHKKGAVIHFRRRDWQICDTDVMNDSAVAVPLKPGGLLLFHGLIHHGTPSNHTDTHRRAVQYHYRSTNIQTTSEEERLLHWGSEGKNVSC